MRKFIIITHGKMATGVLDTLTMLIGKIENFEALSCYVDGDDTDIHGFIKTRLDSLPEDGELIIFTDILGGSINNEAMLLLDNPKLHLIAGVNIATMAEILNGDVNTPIDILINEVIVAGRESLVYCNILNQNITDDEF